jgi:hypothetical protein
MDVVLGDKTWYPPWTSTRSRALRPSQRTRPMFATPEPSPESAQRFHPSQPPPGSPHRPVMLQALPGIHGLPSQLGSRSLTVRATPPHNLQTKQAELDKGAVVDAISSIGLRSRRAQQNPVTRSIGLRAIFKTLGAQLSPFGKTFEKFPSPLEQGRSTEHRRNAPASPVGRNYAAHGPFDTLLKLENPSGRTLPTLSSSPMSMGLHSMAASPDLSPTRDSDREQNNPRQGDLYLDGPILGRWLTQQLDHELVRPRAGISAVDPRITPSWGGPSLAT